MNERQYCLLLDLNLTELLIKDTSRLNFCWILIAAGQKSGNNFHFFRHVSLQFSSSETAASDKQVPLTPPEKFKIYLLYIFELGCYLIHLNLVVNIPTNIKDSTS